MIDYYNRQPVLPSGAVVPLSGAVRADGLVFVSGQLAVDEHWRLIEGDIAAQTRQVLANVARQLRAAGTSLEQVVKMTVWLSRKEDFPAFNEEYARAFGGRPPARSTVVSELLIPGALVEIEAVARAGDSTDC